MEMGFVLKNFLHIFMEVKMNKHYQCKSNYGPGGRNCTCCGPAPVYRLKFDREVKKRDRREAKKEISQALAA